MVGVKALPSSCRLFLAATVVVVEIDLVFFSRALSPLFDEGFDTSIQVCLAIFKQSDHRNETEKR